jgi:hypothetical protein
VDGGLSGKAATTAATTVNGQACQLGSTCTVTAAPSGTAGGDLSGSFPSPTVAAVNGGSVPSLAKVIGTNGSNQIVTATAHSTSAIAVCTGTSGNGSAYTCSTSPTFTPAANDQILFVADVASGTGPTINVNSLGAKAITKFGNVTPLETGDISQSQVTILVYDGTEWQAQNVASFASPNQATYTVDGITFKTIRAAATACKAYMAAHYSSHGVCNIIDQNQTEKIQTQPYDFTGTVQYNVYLQGQNYTVCDSGSPADGTCAQAFTWRTGQGDIIGMGRSNDALTSGTAILAGSVESAGGFAVGHSAMLSLGNDVTPESQSNDVFGAMIYNLTVSCSDSANIPNCVINNNAQEMSIIRQVSIRDYVNVGLLEDSVGASNSAIQDTEFVASSAATNATIDILCSNCANLRKIQNTTLNGLHAYKISDMGGSAVATANTGHITSINNFDCSQITANNNVFGRGYSSYVNIANAGNSAYNGTWVVSSVDVVSGSTCNGITITSAPSGGTAPSSALTAGQGTNASLQLAPTAALVIGAGTDMTDFGGTSLTTGSFTGLSDIHFEHHGIGLLVTATAAGGGNVTVDATDLSVTTTVNTAVQIDNFTAIKTVNIHSLTSNGAMLAGSMITDNLKGKIVSGSTVGTFIVPEYSSGNNSGILVRGLIVDQGGSITTAGTGTVSANQVNGLAVPTSAMLVATNSSKQLTAVTNGGVGVTSGGALTLLPAVNTQTTTYSTVTGDCGDVVEFTGSSNTVITMTTSSFPTGCTIRYVNAGTAIVTLTPASGVIQASGSTLAKFFLGLNGSVDMVFDGTNFNTGPYAPQILYDSGYVAPAANNCLSGVADTNFGLTCTLATSYTNFNIGQFTLPAGLLSANTSIRVDLDGAWIYTTTSNNLDIGMKFGSTSGLPISTVVAPSAAAYTTSRDSSHAQIYIQGTTAPGAGSTVVVSASPFAGMNQSVMQNNPTSMPSINTSNTQAITLGAIWAGGANNAVMLNRVVWTLTRQ